MKKFFIAMLLAGAILMPNTLQIAHGQTVDMQLKCEDGKCTYVLLEPLPGIDVGGDITRGDSSDFYKYINGIIMLLIIIGAMLAVVRFSIGGILFMTSEVAATRTKAKSQMWACIWGLLLLISSVFILTTINPKLVEITLFKSLEDVKKAPSTP